MTDSNQQYQRLAKHLSNTRKSLQQVCREHDVDLEAIDSYVLQQYIDQCSHCNIWAKKLIDDLDGNPICRVCLDIAGL